MINKVIIYMEENGDDKWWPVVALEKFMKRVSNMLSYTCSLYNFF
jgi:hypothetical protein